MAFGLEFNKAKTLGTAEKLAGQGKFAAAIEEYRKVLGRDPKDLTLLATIADLYVRDGKNDEAVKLFYKLAEQFLDAGLVPRAIAVYKRITKIVPDSVQAVLKLGDLCEMGAAQEIAGDLQGALRSFLEVDSRNIDYRDVANRIRTLQQ